MILIIPWRNLKGLNLSMRSWDSFISKNSWILFITGSLFAYWGKICKCLCLWDAPDSSPPLKKRTPSKACLTVEAWSISCLVTLSVWGWNSLVITRRWLLYMLNLLNRSLWLSPRSFITRFWLYYGKNTLDWEKGWKEQPTLLYFLIFLQAQA